ncbi:roadblock/LC7 domain-containing protein [Actinacidiphila sp. bgisy167]|uniref:roadblock/LC7 domain-containing protein n=1 Tax=Actinacidiphila sp. bgisy167 TaxID=3413797 RepID=UPI003D72EED1
METNRLIDEDRTPLDGLLTDLRSRVTGTEHVLLATGDGLKIAWSEQDTAEAEKLAAVMTGLLSLARGAFVTSPGGVRQVVVEHDAGALFVMSAEGSAADPRLVGTLLGVLTTERADPGEVGYEMKKLIKALEEHLTVHTRQTQPSGRGQ